MTNSESSSKNEEPQSSVAKAILPAGWLANYPWVTFLLPMIVYMLIGTLEPLPPDPGTEPPATSEILDQLEEPAKLNPYYPPAQTGLLPPIPYRYYPCVYTSKILITLVTMLVVCPGYRSFLWRVSGLSIAVGVVGVVFWIALCHLRIEPKLIGPIDRFLGGLIPGADQQSPSIGLMSILGTGERSAFNPLAQLASEPFWAYAFLAVRFAGLALVVPVIEEFFLRGFLMRYVMHQNWWEVPFGSVNRTAVIVGTAIPMLMHPGELLAALVWFSMVTWLMVRTRNIWDCVIAHAVTNLLLGIYVVATDNWQLM